MQKPETMNYIDIENRLLEMDAAGIASVRVILELNQNLANTVNEVLNERLESDSDEQIEEDQLNYGKYSREVKKSNAKEMMGMLKYQKRQIQQLEQKFSGKTVDNILEVSFYEQNNIEVNIQRYHIYLKMNQFQLTHHFNFAKIYSRL